MESLKNSIFQLEIKPEKGTYSILPLEERFLKVTDASIYLEYRSGRRKHKAFIGPWEKTVTRNSMQSNTPHGDIDCIVIDLSPDQNSIKGCLTFGIVQEYPLVLWKMEITNQGKQAVELEKFVLLDVDGRSGKIVFPKAKRQEEMGFFSNGWQSWSASQWYSGDSKMHNSKLGPFQLPMIQNAGTPRLTKWGEFSSDFFAVLGDQVNRTGALMGFLSQKEQFGSIVANFNRSPRYKMWANGDGAVLDPGKSMETDWAVYNPILLDHRDPLDKCTEAVARENQVKIPEEVPVGWCSWYHYYTKVTASDVQDNLQVILDKQEKIPVQLVQIDDGFESQVGDWFTFKSTFPEGVAPLADQIRAEGLIPGLWLAPFIVQPDSDLMKNHPDWILRTRRRKPVNAGLGWGKFCTALDLTIPAALDYAVKVVKTAAEDWHYPYLKLDFLYAAALPGQFADRSMTRAQVMRRGMEALRQAVGPRVFLLGCGAPLGSVLGLVDAMRIGADVSGDWTPKFGGLRTFFIEEPSMPCARNSIRNILTRANLHRHWWMNDPDCLLVRPGTSLTLDEVRTLATAIGLTGGSLLLSDDLTRLPEERIHLSEVLLPVIGERARVIDWFDHEFPTRLRVDLVNETGESHLVGGFNWEYVPKNFTITPATFDLPDGEYWICEFWSGKLVRFNKEHPAVFKNIPPHGCLAASVRRVVPDIPQYLGSDLHLSQGIEVAEWNPQPGRLELKLRLPRKAKGNIILYIPGEVTRVTVNSGEVEVVKPEEHLLQIPIQMDGFAQVVVFFNE